MKNLIHFSQRFIPRTLLIRLSYVFMWFSDIYYKGDNYTCPINQKSYRKFLPYGAHQQRINVLCPGNLSLERHRLLWLFLKEKTNFFSAKLKMLHIAPEQCYYDRFRKMSTLDYTTADLNSPIADIHMDLHSIPLEDNTYDVIFCNHVLEHVKDDHQCMTELYRVLKPGGFAILQIPQDLSRETTLEDDPNITDPFERERIYWQKDHLRLYGRDYADKLRKAGFTVDQNDFVNTLSSALIERYRLPSNEPIYYCSKPKA